MCVNPQAPTYRACQILEELRRHPATPIAMLQLAELRLMIAVDDELGIKPARIIQSAIDETPAYILQAEQDMITSMCATVQDEHGN